MTQATGANAYISFWEESTLGTRPGSPSPYLIAAAVEGASLKETVQKLTSNAISGNRGARTARGGNRDVSGSIPFELPLLGIGKLFKHALGPVTTTSVKLATMGSGVTGVVVRCAESTCTAGAGTITKASATTVTWQAQGDTAGVAVDISAGGDFTLQSGSAGKALYITTTGTLNGTSATVTVGAAAYQHVIKRGALPAGMGIEIGYTDIGKYFTYDGVRINGMSLTIGNDGYITGSLDLLGMSQAAPLGSSVGAYTSAAHNPIVHHEALLLEAGATANILNLDMQMGNALDAVRTIGSRTITSLKEGQGELTGRISTLFENETMINKVRNTTSSTLRTFCQVTGGLVEFYVPTAKYFGDAGVGIPTSKGIVLPNDWSGEYNSTEATDLRITIVNSEATL